MWRPDFPYLERRGALMPGVHRSLCVYSYVHRGTPERPGLVLGLNRGGSCRGVAFRVDDADWPDVVAYLRGREQVTMVYHESVRRVMLDGIPPEKTRALCYVVDRRHEQFAGDLPVDAMVEIIAAGRGKSGENPDYVFNTVDHLRETGIADHKLYEIERRLRERP